ncbi:MAG: hypothetical protein ABJE66_00505 [Deltaproteobacteria bacterium]
MEIVLIACVATLAACAVLARLGKRAPKTRLLDDSGDKIDQALFHLINEVTREATPHRSPYAYASSDAVMMASRMGALEKPHTI